MPSKYQTLSQFLYAPFNRSENMEKNVKYDKLYQEFRSNNTIKISGFAEIEDSYYFHVSVPSESNKDGKYSYDVVIRFFTDRADVVSSNTLNDYYIQFFSNSPGFIYRYAALYKDRGYLIENLQSKMDKEFADVMPENTNAKLELSYDKSIYFACRFLSEQKFRALYKRGFILQKKKSPQKFLDGISDFKSVKLDQDILSSEKKLKRVLDDRIEKKKQRYENKTPKTHSTSHTVRSNTKKTASKSTSRGSSSIVKRGTKNKITASRNTRRK